MLLRCFLKNTITLLCNVEYCIFGQSSVECCESRGKPQAKTTSNYTPIVKGLNNLFGTEMFQSCGIARK